MNSQFHFEFHFKMQVTIRNTLSAQERSWLGVNTDTSPEPCTTSRADSFCRLPAFPFLSILSPVFLDALPQTPKQPNWSKMFRFSSRKLNTVCYKRLCLLLSPGHHLINPEISTTCAENPQNVTQAVVSHAVQGNIKLHQCWKWRPEPRVTHILLPSLVLLF